MTKLKYPAITICKDKGFADPGEYLRSVFNNFQLTYTYNKEKCTDGEDGSCSDNGTCEATSLLRNHYQQYIGSCDRTCHRNEHCSYENGDGIQTAWWPKFYSTRPDENPIETSKNLNIDGSLQNPNVYSILWIEAIMKALNIWQHRMPRQVRICNQTGRDCWIFALPSPNVSPILLPDPVLHSICTSLTSAYLLLLGT